MIPGENTGVATILFTDVEGSTLLWEQDPERMRLALARHDDVLRDTVESQQGSVVKMMGDGMHAMFDDPLEVVNAALRLQQELADAGAITSALRVYCGLHIGAVERHDSDFFGTVVNRAARIMGIARGGQILVSQRVAALVADRLPPQLRCRATAITFSKGSRSRSKSSNWACATAPSSRLPKTPTRPTG